MPDAVAAPSGVYKPRRPQASPLFRLVSDHLHRLQTVYDERFAREYGPWRSVVAQVADKLLACGVLEHGVARIRCDACAHEYLLAFSCTCRYFCPSCHAKRLAIWTQWLDTTLLAPVPHRQVVLTIPKRLRAYCLYRRRLLGEIARVAARTVTAAIRALTGERDLAVGIVACLQTHGSRANWHPHLHLLVTDGGFRADGTFVSWPVHDTARLTEAFRRAVLRLFVRLALFDEEQAAGMLTWPHSGFHVHTAVWVSEDDRAFATRLARYLRAESRRPGTADLRPDGEGGHLPVRHVRRPDGGHRDGGPARVPRPRAGPHSGQGARDHAVLRLVCQPPPRHAGHGGDRGSGHGSGRGARDRPRATAGADRGQPPMGGAPAADLRGRPAGLPDLSRAHADHRVHHPGLGDRPDPRAPPPPRRDGGPRRRAESALDPRTVGTGRHATARCGPPGPLSRTPTPRSRAGTFGVRVRPTGASDRPLRRPGAHGKRRPDGYRDAAAGGGQAAARRPALARSAIAPYVRRILDRARLKFLSRDELITDLSRMKAVRVISRTTAMQYKNSTLSLREIGTAVGVRCALTGSVRRAGSALRISAQLVDVRRDQPEWAEKYSGTLDDVFDVQERVSRAIVEALDIALSPQESAQLAARPLQDVRAFELYLKAREALGGYDVERAAPLIAGAVDIAGRVPVLRALEAMSGIMQLRTGASRHPALIASIEREARALSAEAPQFAQGHALLGYLAYETGDPATAVRALRRAIELDPSDADIRFFLSISLQAGGKPDTRGGLQWLADDPLSPLANIAVGANSWWTGRFAEGTAYLEQAVRLVPAGLIFHWGLGNHYALIGRYEEAARQAAWLTEHAPQFAYTPTLQGLLLGAAGRHDEAQAVLDAIDMVPLDGHHIFHLAESYAGAGASARAVKLIDRALTMGFTGISDYCEQWSPFFVSLRGRDDFAQSMVRARDLAARFKAAVG